MPAIPAPVTIDSWRRLVAVLAAVFMLVSGASSVALAADQQKRFATPAEAAKEFVTAARADDTNALLAILGADAKALISSGDAVADKQARARFVKFFDEANKLTPSGESKAILSVGKGDWPWPIPLVKDAAGWRFDAKAGAEEIINRRIGRNELSTIQSALAYMDAQREYYAGNPQRDKLQQYAQKFVSTEGKRDGLYWPAKAGEKPSPLGPGFTRAKAEGYAKGEPGKPVPYHGYHYRILKGQGPDAPGGAYDYVAQGRMIGGFALVAYPATYGVSGVMTFIVNHDGVVYEKDLGRQTAGVAAKMTKFNPDKTWKAVSP